MNLRARVKRLEKRIPKCKGGITKIVINNPDYVPVDEDRCPGCGEPAGYATQALHRFGPAGASAEVSSGDGSVLVRVSARLPIGNALLPAIHVVGHAQIACEVGTTCAGDGIGLGAR